MSTASPSSSDLNALFQKVEQTFPPTWRQDRWYLTATAALIGSGLSQHVGDLYTYLINQAAYSTSAQRQHLIRRMREAMIKCIILNGIPVVFKALLSVAQREREEDKDYSFSREGWQADTENRARGLRILEVIYRDDHAKIMEKYAAHKDLAFVSAEISYGLFLANHDTLSLPESEMVILPAIMCQNLKAEAMWHVRGCVRAGIKPDDTELIQQSLELVAAFAGKKLDVGRVADISDEMHSIGH